jgi:hypothetical protein
MKADIAEFGLLTIQQQPKSAMGQMVRSVPKAAIYSI